MYIIIMGCGRVGEQLARLLDEEDNEVVVIDYNKAALDRLGPDFKGRKVKGVGFDQDVLEKAGIREAAAFAATSSSDNANIVAARIARMVFKVPRVVARLYDPGRAEVYSRLGLRTISSTTWGAERIREILTHSELDPVYKFGSGEVSLIQLEAPNSLIGRSARHLMVSGEFTVVSVTRDGHAFIPISGTEFKANDLIHIAVISSAKDRLKEMLDI